MENKDYQYLEENIKKVKDKIEDVCKRAGRAPESVTLIGVTKTYEADIMNAGISYGIRDIGENKVQEIIRKYDEVDKNVKWHLIGHLQTNKVKYIIDKVDLIHSVDSLKLAKEISKRAQQYGKTMEVLIQVDIDGEETKFGVAESHVEELVKNIAELPNIKLKGLMNIAPIYDDREKTRGIFKKMRKIFDELQKMKYDNIEMEYLSMGMSGDFDIAIEEGANLIRIGTSIYGARDYTQK